MSHGVSRLGDEILRRLLLAIAFEACPLLPSHLCTQCISIVQVHTRLTGHQVDTSGTEITWRFAMGQQPNPRVFSPMTISAFGSATKHRECISTRALGLSKPRLPVVRANEISVSDGVANQPYLQCTTNMPNAKNALLECPIKLPRHDPSGFIV